MYSITAILWSYENGQLVSSEENLFHPETQDDFPVVDATGSFEISEGGSVQFTLAYTHPLYDALTPLETYLRVMDDDKELFYGRILSRSDPTFTGQISYIGEGALSFLRDGEVPPEARDAKGQLGKRTMTAEAFFRWCIEQHNATVGDPRRQFTVGQITIDKKNESREYQVTSYTDTRSAIDQYLRNVYGGYLRTRSDGNGGQYIDWIKRYDRLNPQAIEIGVNVMELSNTLNADGIYTVLRPVGANGLLLNPETIDLFPPEKMAVIGRIVKSVTFQNADTAEKLQTVAEEYAARIGQSLLSEVNIRLVDMHYLDGTSPKIRIGDRFNNIIGTNGAEFTIGHIDADFLHAANDLFSFKNVNDLEGDLNSGLGGGTISRATSRGARSAGLGLKYYSETTDKAVLATKEIEIRATELLSVIANNARIAATNYERVSRTLEIEDGFMVTDWPEWQPNHLYHKDNQVSVIENHKRVGYICLDDDYTSRESWDEEEKTHWAPVESTKTSLATLWGTDVIQNSNQIAQVAGNFQVLTDYYDDWPTWQPDHDYKVNDRIKRSVGGKYFGYVCTTAHHSSTNLEDDLTLYWEEQHNRKSVRLLDGAAFQVDDLNGNMMTVGARIDTLGGDLSNLNEVVNEQGEIVTGMVGSALWTQRDQITGVSGEFDVVTDPTTGKKRLVIKSGGGIKIRKGNTEFGLYDEDNLSGGILVQKINDGSTVTKINGDKVNITATQIASWGVYTDDNLTGGIIAEKINAGGAGSKINFSQLDSNVTDYTAMGLFDDDTLTGGVLVQKINDGSTVTKISGTKVEIDSTQVKVGSTSTVDAWMTQTGQDIDELEGLVADKATIAQLNAQKARIDTIAADYISTQNLKSSVANIDLISVQSLQFANGTTPYGTTNYTNLRQMVEAYKIVYEDSQYKLKVKKYNSSDWIDAPDSVTFNFATTLTPSWSGSPVTVAAKQMRGGSLTPVATFSSVIEPKFIHTTNPDKYYISIHHADNGAQSPSEYTSTRTEIKLGTLSATPTIVRVLNADGTSFINDTPMYTIPLQTRTLTANGTYGPTGSNIGLSSVTVNVPSDLGNAKVRFNKNGSSGTMNYYIEAYNVSSMTPLSGTAINYKLDRNGTNVQIQDTSGTQIGNTPEYAIPLQTRTLTANGTYGPTGSNIGLSSVTVNVPTGTMNPKSTFGAASGSYYIVTTEGDGGNEVSGSSKTYKLGLSGTTVQIQNSSGTKYSSTPEYTIPLRNMGTVTTNKKTYTAGDGYVGMSSIYVDVPTGTMNPKSTFGAASGSYYVVTTEGDGGNEVSGSSKTYKLGLSGTKVQIQNSSGTKYGSTPEFTISLSDWSLALQSGTQYTYKASAIVNGTTTYTSGNLSAKGAFDNGVSSVTVPDANIAIYGSPAASATSINVRATASNGNYGQAAIPITTQRNDAYNRGGATAKVNQSSQMLGYGGSVTVTAQYVNAAGTTVNTSSSCVITAPADNQATGWTEAYQKVKWPGENTSSATLTFKAPAATKATNPNQVSRDYVLSSGNNVAYVKQGTTVVAQLSHNCYTTGYRAGSSGVNLGSLQWETEPAQTITVGENTVTVSTTGRVDSSGTADNLSKSISIHTSQGSWDGNKVYVYVSHTNTAAAHRIARWEVDASSRYTNGWNDGYDTARGYISMPASTPTTIPSTITIKGPNSARTASENYRTYALGPNGNNEIVLFTSVSGSNVTVAKYTHNQYTNGQNSVNVLANSWVQSPIGGSVTRPYRTYSPSPGSGDSVKTTFRIDAESANNKFQIWAYDNDNSSNQIKILERAVSWTNSWSSGTGTVTVKFGGLTVGSHTITDSNLIAENIKNGVKIFNVTGNYSGGSGASYYDRGEWTCTAKTQAPQGTYYMDFHREWGASAGFPSWVSNISVGSKVRFYTTF